MLQAQHLVKRFFGVTVVNDVSFDVHRGEVVGYLGPNGSGKSTTAKMLTGLLDASSGAVLFDGQDVSRDPVRFRQRFGVPFPPGNWGPRFAPNLASGPGPDNSGRGASGFTAFF